MAATNKVWIARAANKVDIKTVKVGDRVKHGKTLGTVVHVGKVYGSIQWDGDDEPTESGLKCWDKMQKA